MARRTRRLSEQGKELIKQAKDRKKQEWQGERDNTALIKESFDEEWRRRAREFHPSGIYITEATFKRFRWYRQAIAEDTFIALCQAIDVNPDEVTDYTDLDIICIGDLPEAPKPFCGRISGLKTLQQWIVAGKRLIILNGRAGIGKTALAYQLMKQIASQFEFLIWISLDAEPLLDDVLNQLICSLSKGKERQGSLTDLMGYFNQYRCFVVIDNWETIVADAPSRRYRSDYENYGDWLKRMYGKHKSCFILIGREQPPDMASIKVKAKDMLQEYQLEGLHYEEDKEILKAEGLMGTEAELKQFIEIYNNPLILKILAETMRGTGNTNVKRYVGEKSVTLFRGDDDSVSGIKDEFRSEFRRLSRLEQDIVYWLALWRIPASWQQIQHSLFSPVGVYELDSALASLIKQRSIVKVRDIDLEDSKEYYLDQLTTQLATASLVEQSCQELSNAVLQQEIRSSAIFVSHAFVPSGHAELEKEQTRRVIARIAACLLRQIPNEVQLQQDLQTLSTQLRADSARYAAQNLERLVATLS
ncbi:NACHT domain-containing protein [Leptolyngbya sp. NK1-12]|uniref:NACHT domain-containing protein n=1 Tax=Leptolyngbya sp. NK1-12 TaxID=2547451 RepID=A0AA96WJ49_9CYAN|nr:NACHT domain-containing protein [Leptolyngbya sp. NK1-12]